MPRASSQLWEALGWSPDVVSADPEGPSEVMALV